MKKTILILSIMALVFASCKRDELLEEGDKWHNGHAAVDLGLPSGLYWATCNIGASVPEESGDYYAWGETSVKKYYSEENSETYMSRMNDISGDAQYDAARAIWGGQWRMPTKYEMQELLNLCSWERMKLNGGIEGFEITGPNGNSIFLPAAGAKDDDYIYNKGHASYWTSKPYKGDTSNEEYNIGCAYGYYSNQDQDELYTFSKCTGLTIRPVFGGNEKPIGIDAVSRYVENLTSTTARFSVRVLQEETSTIETYGACWSTDTKPTMDDYHYTFYEYYDHDNDGSCLDEVYLENLQPNTKYYIRAFATHGDAVVYGEIMSFTTLPEESGQENGHSYIDLGLPSGVKWSMCNYGSYSGNPWNYGDYLSWGGEYNYDYAWNPNNCPTYGIEMGDISGSQYDYVNESWGGQWRMPTLYEMQELRDYCTWEWFSNDDYNWYAYKVTGPNGNSIILPVCGYYEGNEHYNYQGTDTGAGYYWTSTPYDDGSNNNAYCLEFGGENVQITPKLRYYGLNIRPVIGYNEDLYPVVRMNDVTDITTNSAKCSASIEYSGTVENYGRGFVWSKNYASPTLENYDNCVYADYYENDYSCEIYNLNPNTAYYVRAFVRTLMGDVYSDVFSFTTLEEETISGTENGHDYVDLGLPSGLKWATCNVGASNATDYGDYYAWGETTTKTEYTEDNSLTYGKQMNDISGNPQYDAATANWGGGWRMPTYDELRELMFNCTWTWNTQNGVNGYKVEGPNGNSIFLPVTGYCDGSLLYDVESNGLYWSSTPYEGIVNDALHFGFSNGSYSIRNVKPCLGYSVRPVFGGNFTGPEEQPEEPETPSANQSFTVNGVSFTMIAVEGGTFKMGAQSSDSGGDNYDSDAEGKESPVHDVTLSSYYIGETEVTQELWEAVMGSNPSYYSGSQKPVESISWNDCQEFFTKLNNLTGKNFRLPTEAEWEYAARGGNKSKGYKYSGSNKIENVAWYGGYVVLTTHDVKTKQANELGIYDMSGNVWEWCQDWYGSYSSGSQTNPTGPISGSFRVLRGGGYNGLAGRCRVSDRLFCKPDHGYDNYGFRLILQELQ